MLKTVWNEKAYCNIFFLEWNGIARTLFSAHSIENCCNILSLQFPEKLKLVTLSTEDDIMNTDIFEL